jgi:hypothetical protein
MQAACFFIPVLLSIVNPALRAFSHLCFASVAAAKEVYIIVITSIFIERKSSVVL